MKLSKRLKQKTPREQLSEKTREISSIYFMFSYVLYIRGGVDRHARLFKFVICVHLLFSINIVLPIDLLASRFGVVRCVENRGFHIRKTI